VEYYLKCSGKLYLIYIRAESLLQGEATS